MKGCRSLIWLAVFALLFTDSGEAAAAANSTVGPTLVAMPVVNPRIEILEIVGPRTRPPDPAQKRIAAERAAQQQASREKIEENARARGGLSAAEPEPAVAFHRRLEQAERFLAEENFYMATRALEAAMKVKPKELPISERVRILEDRVKALCALVEVGLKSDGETTVSVDSVLPPQRFYTARIKLMPGDYEVKGSRRDRMDVIYLLRVRNGEPLPALVTVICK